MKTIATSKPKSGTACKITYLEFKVRLAQAPPPPVSIPDYEAKRAFLATRRYINPANES